MNTKNTQTLLSITTSNIANLSRTQASVPIECEEFRLVAVQQNAQQQTQELTCFRNGHGYKATLPATFHEQLQPLIGRVIKIDFNQKSVGHERMLTVRRLSAVDAATNPFNTFMPLWLAPSQMEAYAELIRIVNLLEGPYKDLVVQVFRDDALFEAFLDRPASLWHHHNEQGGLLEHTVEVARDCERTCANYPSVNANLTICGALLHDIGKVEEYSRLSPSQYSRSQVGELEMHKILGVGIVKHAGRLCHSDPIMLSEVCHLLVAANGQQYMGLPNHKMAEPAILQGADAQSAAIDLHRRKHKLVTNWNLSGRQYQLPRNSK